MKPAARTERPPVVVVLGHVDHGKSSLLDYLRKSNIVAGEAGGITQHTAAYEVLHTTAGGVEKRITFIDTPGHEAFGAQRRRGATLADIAILVVSAEDGVKAQTKEALKAINESKIPYIVAINKIDLPNANVERTLGTLTENEVYLEGRGGSVPYVPISAKRGDGIPELLELIVLSADLSEFTGDTSRPAEGIVVEAHRDPKIGISATFIIKDGTLATGMFLATEGAFTPVRAMKDSLRGKVDTATFSSAVTVVGWSALPSVGNSVKAFEKKKDAESFADTRTVSASSAQPVNETSEGEESAVIPLIIKADVVGSLDAVKHEIGKLTDDRVRFKIIHADVGAISENDIKRAGGDDRAVIVGFNTAIESGIRETAERAGVLIETNTIIYKLSEWLADLLQQRRPKRMTDEQLGSARVLKTFSKTRNKQIIGGRVEEGIVKVGGTIQIMRRGEEIGKGKILELQQGKQDARQVAEGIEFGTKIDATVEIASGDILVEFTRVEK
ncbi:MAG: translation initiation factor IF-2 [Candidatus Pacebacteria bacterium]|nr:translation initiation factor IF-2 [Candidatus Paceibacterota bacterium]